MSETATFPYTIRRVPSPTQEEIAAIVDVVVEAWRTAPATIIAYGEHIDTIVRPRAEMGINAVLNTGQVFVCEDPKANRIVGVTAWVPPGRDLYDEPAEGVAIWNTLSALLPEKERQVVAKAGERMNTFTEQALGPSTKHDEWYLFLVGVHPSYAGQRIASTMIAEQLKQTDPYSVALECNENRVKLYERLGWEVKGREAIAGLGGELSFCAMLRPPTSGRK